jgi:hypothetical protein
MSQAILIVTLAVLGAWHNRNDLSCWQLASNARWRPFRLFFAAALLAKQTRSRFCTFAASSIAVGFGLHSYHEAFVAHVEGEVDALAVLLMPAIPAVLGIAALLASLFEWFGRRRKGGGNAI